MEAEHARDVAEEGKDDDEDDGQSNAPWVDERPDMQRFADGHVSVERHGGGEPDARVDGHVDEGLVIGGEVNGQ